MAGFKVGISWRSGEIWTTVFCAYCWGLFRYVYIIRFRPKWDHCIRKDVLYSCWSVSFLYQNVGPRGSVTPNIPQEWLRIVVHLWPSFRTGTGHPQARSERAASNRRVSCCDMWAAVSCWCKHTNKRTSRKIIINITDSALGLLT
jgi:hypothetical protein